MTRLERMQRTVLREGSWPADWMVRDTAAAVEELAEEQAILGARLELAQRYILRGREGARRAIVALNKRVWGPKGRSPLILG